LLKKIKEFCKYGVVSGEQLLRNVIKKRNKKNFVKGKIAGYKSVLEYIEILEKRAKK